MVFEFTDQDVANLDCRQWKTEKDWTGNELPIPDKFKDCDETTRKAWNTWLFLCGTIKIRLRKILPNGKIPNNKRKILLYFSGDDKSFTLKINRKIVREKLGLPEIITVEADCPYKAYIKIITQII